MRIEEKSLILPALYIIKRDGPISMTELIAELTAVFHPTGEDAVILAGRQDTKFSQKVRNLRSHRDANKMAIYTSLTSSGKYVLTAAGEQYLGEHLEQVEYLFSNKFQYSHVVDLTAALEKTTKAKRQVYVYREEDMVTEGATTAQETVVRMRSRLLRRAAIERYKSGDGKLYCEVCGFCFEDHYGSLGQDFIEIHHEDPIYQYSDDGFERYISDAVEKVKPLCANCHRMIHRNRKRPLSIEELKAIWTK